MRRLINKFDTKTTKHDCEGQFCGGFDLVAVGFQRTHVSRAVFEVLGRELPSATDAENQENNPPPRCASVDKAQVSGDGAEKEKVDATSRNAEVTEEVETDEPTTPTRDEIPTVGTSTKAF